MIWRDADSRTVLLAAQDRLIPGCRRGPARACFFWVGRNGWPASVLTWVNYQAACAPHRAVAEYSLTELASSRAGASFFWFRWFQSTSNRRGHRLGRWLSVSPQFLRP